MTADQYEVVRADVRDEADAPRGRELYYRCGICGEVIPSQPDDNVGCKCGNIFIDIDYHRLVVKDFSCFEVVKRKDSRG